MSLTSFVTKHLSFVKTGRQHDQIGSVFGSWRMAGAYYFTKRKIFEWASDIQQQVLKIVNMIFFLNIIRYG
jgi:hypothetical protein